LKSLTHRHGWKPVIIIVAIVGGIAAILAALIVNSTNS